MKFKDALKHKKEAEKNADPSVANLFHIVITPASTEESAVFIEEFLKNPGAFHDESCRSYCSDDEYEVVSFKKETE